MPEGSRGGRVVEPVAAGHRDRIRRRSLKRLLLTLLTLGLTCAVGAVPAHLAAAQTVSTRRQVDWEMGGAHRAESPTASAKASGVFCHGHADPPHSAREYDTKKKKWYSGVGYDAYQDCEGDFDTQKLCVQLWYLDYYANEHLVSTMSCGAETVAIHVYRGRFLRCATIDLGRVPFFTKTRGTVYPVNGPAQTGRGSSDTKTLC